MNCVLDNTDLIREKTLKFDKRGDFYFALVLKRRKDTSGKMLEGVNEDNRLIKHFFIYDIDYFDRKIDSIRNLCDANNARAYILPQRRHDATVLLELHKKTGELIEERLKNLMAKSQSPIADNLGNNGVHFDHLIRSCVAGCHLSDRKRWIIDLDRDNEALCHVDDTGFANYTSAIIERVRRIREMYGQSDCFDCYTVPTPHGCHIVTEPFNKKEIDEHNPPGWESAWLKEDAMTLLYSSLKNQ